MKFTQNLAIVISAVPADFPVIFAVIPIVPAVVPSVPAGISMVFAVIVIVIVIPDLIVAVIATAPGRIPVVFEGVLAITTENLLLFTVNFPL